MSVQYETIIGLEIHAQVSSKTKMFCACDNDSFAKAPNTNVCPICMAFPGMLPVPNLEAIEKGIRAAIALKCSIPKHSKFDRKNYFYPDLPPGFQISQYDEPVSENGKVQIKIGDQTKQVGITRLHLENDAGKLTHTGTTTLLDFNRAGTPLMEIVSDPDLRSAEEAKAYAETIQKILRYVGSSDCDMEKGMMRFDASVSLRPKGDEKLYPRAEIKNLNSIRSLEAAIEYEVKRQKKLWEAGSPLDHEQTVGWDDDRGTTEVMRSKESAADYRYFPEPDIPPIEVSEDQLKLWRAAIPELPDERTARFISEYGMDEPEAIFYTEDRAFADYFEKVAKESQNIKASMSFVGTILVKQLKDAGLKIEESPVKIEQIIELIKMIDANEVSNSAARGEVFEELMKGEGESPAVIVDRLGLKQVSDDSAIETFCKEAIAANPASVEDFKNGKEKALGALVGFVMKASKGSANPKMVNDKLRSLLVE